MAKTSVARFVVPFLVGVVAAPFIKPLVRGGVKSAVGATLKVRVLAAEAAKEVHEMAAEVTADAAQASARQAQG